MCCCLYTSCSAAAVPRMVNLTELAKYKQSADSICKTHGTMQSRHDLKKNKAFVNYGARSLSKDGENFAPF